MALLATPRLALDIRGQPASLQRVFTQHTGSGRPQLQKAAAMLSASQRVVITGIGASLNAALPLDSLLASRGIDSLAVECGELLHYRLAACEGATVVVVSRSGESIEIARLLAALKGRTPLIGITSEPGSSLAHEADILLTVGNLPDEMVAIQSYTSTLLTLTLLGRAALGELDAACREAEALLGCFSDWTAAQLTAMHDWDPFLANDPLIHLLGRGPSYASAREGALLCAEVAKAPAIAMPVASFRHGPIEVVDGRFRALLLTPHGPTRELNVGLARDLLRFGGALRMIGPAASGGDGLPWIHTPTCTPLWAPMLEILPLQVAAMRLAELRGVTVGSFRYISQVTRDERAMAPDQSAADKG